MTARARVEKAAIEVALAWRKRSWTQTTLAQYDSVYQSTWVEEDMGVGGADHYRTIGYALGYLAALRSARRTKKTTAKRTMRKANTKKKVN